MDAYNKAIDLKSIDADYAAFQKAISYGFVSKNDKKIEDLNKLIANYSKSQYRDDALFELGNTYVAEKNYVLAIKAYDQLLSEFNKGSYASKSILRQGLVYYNTEKDDLAIAKFKTPTNASIIAITFAPKPIGDMEPYPTVVKV